jgi:hypothetical protein
VGQGDDRLGRDRAGVDPRLDALLEQAKAVAVGHVPPGLPAKHRRGVEKEDPFDRRVGAHLQDRRTPACSAIIGSTGPSARAPAVIRSAISAWMISAAAANRSALSRNWW